MAAAVAAPAPDPNATISYIPTAGLDLSHILMPEKDEFDEETIKAVIANPTKTGKSGTPCLAEYRPYNMAGHTACWMAAKLEMWDECLKLLDLGADPNAIDEYDFTILMWAAMKGGTKVAERLLSIKSVDVDAMTQYGFTAYMWAKKHEHKELAALLLTAGASEEVPKPWDDDCPERYSWKARGGSRREFPPPILPVSSATPVAVS